MPSVVIVSMPWNIEEFVSSQVATLKSYLTQNGVDAAGRHYHKEMLNYLGPKEREQVHEFGYGEHLFAALLYPKRKSLFLESIRDRFGIDLLDGVVSKLDDFAHAAADDLFDANPELIGFTTTHVQIMSSLYLAKLAKERIPETKIVFGGLSLFGDYSEALIKLFPQIDFVVNGEGERALLELWQAVHLKDPNTHFGDIGGLVWRDSVGNPMSSSEPARLVSLDTTSAPDFSEYFNDPLVAGTGSAPHPKICVESARACSWGKCTFCIESIPSRGVYRKKSATVVVNQIEDLVRKTKSVDVAFTDPDMSSRKDVFDEINARGLDLRVMAEVSGLVDLPTLLSMRSAGMNSIQIGIESFSPEILKKFKKGVQLVHYIELMRWCKQLNMSLVYNVIIGSPFETQSELEVAAQNIEFLMTLAPPIISEFVVSLGSPIYQDMERYGINCLKPLPETDCYPSEVRKLIAPLISFHAGFAYETDQVQPDRTAIVDSIDRWWKFWKLGFSITAYRGVNFLDLKYCVGSSERHVMIDDPVEVELLQSVAVEAKGMRQIARDLPAFTTELLEDAAERLIDRQLLFSCDRKYLAIPIFERIDLSTYSTSRNQRYDLPWLSGESNQLGLVVR